MTDEKYAYDSLAAFCIEYGFDAVTTQRIRDDMLAIVPTATALAVRLEARGITPPASASQHSAASTTVQECS